ncbi:hypothetical protein C8R47DRAFT_1076158 [Mycena vitilis]|nr:hypothetical protein C8R47DRAFT_1076158 [Mycena vitilis]
MAQSRVERVDPRKTQRAMAFCAGADQQPSSRGIREVLEVVGWRRAEGNLHVQGWIPSRTGDTAELESHCASNAGAVPPLPSLGHLHRSLSNEQQHLADLSRGSSFSLGGSDASGDGAGAIGYKKGRNTPGPCLDPESNGKSGARRNAVPSAGAVPPLSSLGVMHASAQRRRRLGDISREQGTRSEAKMDAQRRGKKWRARRRSVEGRGRRRTPSGAGKTDNAAASSSSVRALTADCAAEFQAQAR